MYRFDVTACAGWIILPPDLSFRQITSIYLFFFSAQHVSALRPWSRAAFNWNDCLVFHFNLNGESESEISAKTKLDNRKTKIRKKQQSLAINISGIVFKKCNPSGAQRPPHLLPPLLLDDLNSSYPPRLLLAGFQKPPLLLLS